MKRFVQDLVPPKLGYQFSKTYPGVRATMLDANDPDCYEKYSIDDPSSNQAMSSEAHMRV